MLGWTVNCNIVLDISHSVSLILTCLKSTYFLNNLIVVTFLICVHTTLTLKLHTHVFYNTQKHTFTLTYIILSSTLFTYTQRTYVLSKNVINIVNLITRITKKPNNLSPYYLCLIRCIGLKNGSILILKKVDACITCILLNPRLFNDLSK